MSLRVVMEPDEEPVLVADFSDPVTGYLALATTAEEPLIESLITAARRQLERTLGVAFLEQTFELALDRFPCVTPVDPWGALVLPRPPLQSVTSITYVLPDGSTAVWDSANYVVDTAAWPGQITPAYGVTWPDIRYQPNAILVRYVAGFADADHVPDDWKQAIRAAVASLYEHREDLSDIAGSVASLGIVRQLMSSYRIWTS
jgi:uncharacterized phiE125 gp8 family phage protein